MLRFMLMFSAFSVSAVMATADEPVISAGKKSLPLPGEAFKLNGHDAFVILPEAAKDDEVPWVWYAPTLRGLPSGSEVWMFKQFLTKGIAIAGIDVGESYGSPTGRQVYGAFYDDLVKTRKFSEQPVLLARSRGGLMLYSWAADNPQSVGGVAGIYPVCNIASYPGIQRACGAYGLTAEQLKAELTTHNPIDRLKSLAEANVPILHIHGDNDKTVPLSANSAELGKRYRALGGPVEIVVIKGQGHNMWKGWFESQQLTDFIIERALGQSPGTPEPVIKAGNKVSIKGKLKGGLVAIGGETTGWLFTYINSKGSSRIEVDMQAIKQAETFDGAEVTIAGTIESKQYLERGAVLILKAETVILNPSTATGSADLPQSIAHWKLDDTGDIARDASGSHHGKIVGAKSAGGKFGKSLEFVRKDGNHVEIPFSKELALSTFTVSAWVYLTREPTFSGILGTRHGGDHTFDMKVNTAKVHGDIGDGENWIETAVNFYAKDTGTNSQGGDLALNRWYHIVYVIDNTKKECRLYLDADLKKRIAFKGTSMLMTPRNTMHIGHSSGTEFMDGMIDNVKIWDVPLTAGQVKSLWAAATASRR